MEKKEFDKVKYNNEYNKTSYDRFSLMLKKGRKKLIQSVVESKGGSINAYICKAIDSQLIQDGVSLDADDLQVDEKREG